MEERVRWRTLCASLLFKFLVIVALMLPFLGRSRASSVRILVGGTSGVRWFHRHNLSDSDARHLSANTSLAVTCVGIHPNTRHLYWLDKTRGKILRQEEKSRSEPETVINAPTPRQFVIDWIHDHLFWLSGYSKSQPKGRLYISKLDGSSRRVLHGGNILGEMEMDFIAIDPYRGFLFVSQFQWRKDSQFSVAISKLRTDGSLVHTFNATSRSPISSLTVDIVNEKLLWAVDGVLWRSSYSLSGAEDFLRTDAKDIKHVVAGHGHIFFVEGTEADSQLRRTTGKPVSPGPHATLLNDIGTVQHIVVDPSTSTVRGDLLSVPPCANCSHFCVTGRSAKPRCLCPSWSRVSNLTCKETKQFLLVTVPGELKIIYPKLKDARDHVIMETLISTGRSGIYDMAVDRLERRVYWTNEDDGRVMVSPLVNVSAGVLESLAIGWPQSIAVDYLGKNVFWADGQLGVVEVKTVSAEDGIRKTIAKKRNTPRALAINPVAGYAFWSEGDSNGSLWRSSLSGQRPVQLLAGVGHPITALALQAHTSDAWLFFLYNQKVIERIRQNGTQRKVVFLAKSSSLVSGMAVSPSHLFVSIKAGEGKGTVIMRSNSPSSLSSETSLVANLDEPGHLVYVDTAKPLERNRCSRRRWKCAYMCLQEPLKAFSCHCPSGIAQKDKANNKGLRRCPVSSRRLVYTSAVTLRKNSALSKPSADKGKVELLRLPWNSRSQGDIRLSVNSLRNEVFVCSPAENVIRRFIYNDSTGFTEAKKALVVGNTRTSKVGDLSVDWTSGQIFWTDTLAGRIETALLADSDYVLRRVIAWNLQEPELLAVDPRKGLLFFTTTDGCVFASTLSGHNKRPLGCKFKNVSSLVANVATHTLFLARTSEIVVLQYGDVNLSANVQLTVKELKISGVQRSPRLTTWTQRGNPTELIFTSTDEDGHSRLQWHVISVSPAGITAGDAQGNVRLEQIHSIAAFSHSNSQEISVCSFGWVCSGLCLVPDSEGQTTKGIYPQCSCPAHQVKEGNKCRDPSESIVVAGNSIFRLVANGGSAQAHSHVMDTPAAVKDWPPLPIVARYPRRVEVNFHRGNVYWIEESMNSVLMTSVTSSEHRVLVDGQKDTKVRPIDIAVDPLNGNLYWACGISNSVRVVKADGQSLGNYIESMDVFSPKDLVIDPENSELFWVDKFGKHPAEIRRASVSDSSKGGVLFRLEGRGLGEPTHLVVAHYMKALLWIDSVTGVIYSMKLKGRNERQNADAAQLEVFVNTSLKVNGKRLLPGSLAAVKDRVYWTFDSAGQHDGLWMSSLGDRTPQQVLHLSNLTNVASFSADVDFSDNPCYHNNGGCSHFCRRSGNKAKCGCPVSMKLDLPYRHDRCISNDCNPYEFACLSKECKPFTYRCDGQKDCADGSDERNCSCIKAHNQVPCRSDGCYNKQTQRCDGRFDCADRTDELRCEGFGGCQMDEFKCTYANGTQTCISDQGRCNGRCANGLDEENCGDLTLIPDGSIGDKEKKSSKVEKGSSALTAQAIIAIVIGIILVAAVIFLIVVLQLHFRKSSHETVKPKNSRKGLASVSPSSGSVELSTSATDASSSSYSNARASSSDGGKLSQPSEQTEETACRISSENSPMPGSTPSNKGDIFDKTTPDGVCRTVYATEYNLELPSDVESFCTGDNTTYDGISEGASIGVPPNPPPSLATGITNDLQSISTYSSNNTSSVYSHRLQARQQPRHILYAKYRARYEQTSMTDAESMMSVDQTGGQCPSMITDVCSYATESIPESEYAPCPSLVSGLEDMSYAGDSSVAYSTMTSLFGTDTMPPPPPGSPAPTCLTQSEVSQNFQ